MTTDPGFLVKIGLIRHKKALHEGPLEVKDDKKTTRKDYIFFRFFKLHSFFSYTHLKICGQNPPTPRE